jgi:hypothetical protein
MTDVTRRERETRQKPKTKRRVPGGTVCPHCKGRFWAPVKEVMCPHCGKRTPVEHGIVGSPMAFFGSYLEGLALSGAISRIEISHPCPRPSRRSRGLSDVCRKVIPESPHHKRATGGQNHEKELQEEMKSQSAGGRGEIE